MKKNIVFTSLIFLILFSLTSCENAHWEWPQFNPLDNIETSISPQKDEYLKDEEITITVSGTMEKKNKYGNINIYIKPRNNKICIINKDDFYEIDDNDADMLISSEEFQSINKELKFSINEPGEYSIIVYVTNEPKHPCEKNPYQSHQDVYTIKIVE